MTLSFIPSQLIVVRKLEWGTRRERLSYPATVVEVTDHAVVVAAKSTLDGVAIDGVVIVQEDRFTECYYRDRWFNTYHCLSDRRAPVGAYLRSFVASLLGIT